MQGAARYMQQISAKISYIATFLAVHSDNSIIASWLTCIIIVINISFMKL